MGLVGRRRRRVSPGSVERVWVDGLQVAGVKLLPKKVKARGWGPGIVSLDANISTCVALKKTTAEPQHDLHRRHRQRANHPHGDMARGN